MIRRNVRRRRFYEAKHNDYLMAIDDCIKDIEKNTVPYSENRLDELVQELEELADTTADRYERDRLLHLSSKMKHMSLEFTKSLKNAIRYLRTWG